MSGTQAALIGAGASATTRTAIITQTGTFTASFTGLHRFYVLGPGGSGAALTGQSTTGGSVKGGGGGAFAYKECWLNEGDTVDIEIGAGGASVTGSSNGNDGGDTSVYRLGVMDVLCTGGGGGHFTATPGAIPTGGVGGAAIGGDVNFVGGSAGAMAALVAGNFYATGGASAGSIYGNGHDSGDCSSNQTASGGASVRFDSSDTVGASAGAGTGSQNGGSYSTAGFNAFGFAHTALDNSTSPSIQAGISLPVGPLTSIVNPFLRLFGGGTNGVNSSSGDAITSDAGAGAGSGAAISTFGGGDATSGKAGTCAGSGAAMTVSTAASALATSGAAGIGGGSGGAITKSTSASSATSGKGGNGIVVVEW